MKISGINNLDDLGLEIKTEGDEKLPLVQKMKAKDPAQVKANNE